MQGELPVASPDSRSLSPQCFIGQERPRAEEARVSGPSSSLHPCPGPPGSSPRAHSHHPYPLQGDNSEGDPGCAGSPGLPGPPGLPGQRGEEVRPGRALICAGAPRSRGQFHSRQRSSWALQWLPVSWESFRVLGGLRSAGSAGALTSSALLAHRPPLCSRSTGPSPFPA